MSMLLGMYMSLLLLDESLALKCFICSFTIGLKEEQRFIASIWEQSADENFEQRSELNCIVRFKVVTAASMKDDSILGYSIM
jgi:hypothetical protein